MKLKDSFSPFLLALPLALSSCCEKHSCQAEKGSGGSALATAETTVLARRRLRRPDDQAITGSNQLNHPGLECFPAMG